LTTWFFSVTIGDMKDEVQAGRRPYRMTARADAARATASRVLDVAVELFTERPYEDVALEEVAGQAQVAKRTVLRRFGSKEALFVAAMERATREEMRRRDAAPVGDVAGAVANVLDHYERFGANRLRLLSQEDRIAVVAENVEAGRRYHWSWVERTFAPLIEGRNGAAKKRRIATLVALTDVYTWKLLRRDLGLSRAETERTLVELIHKLEGGS
jgi:AcrR family transcriptional regulator